MVNKENNVAIASHFLLLALHKVGRTDLALGLVRAQRGIMNDADSTTTWERLRL
jgi:hypothetical protein